MFSLLAPPWYRDRPKCSGLLAVILGFLIVAVCLTVLKGIHRKDVLTEARSNPHQEHEQHAGKEHRSAVDVFVAPRVNPNVVKPRHPRAKCRCHIDTQEPRSQIVHHNTQFSICETIEPGDEAWHQGSYFKVNVQIRWHCPSR